MFTFNGERCLNKIKTNCRNKSRGTYFQYIQQRIYSPIYKELLKLKRKTVREKKWTKDMRIELREEIQTAYEHVN